MLALICCHSQKAMRLQTLSPPNWPTPRSFGARTHHFISQSMLLLVWDGELFPSLSPQPTHAPKVFLTHGGRLAYG